MRRAAFAALLIVAVSVQCVFAVRLLAGAAYASQAGAAAANGDFSAAEHGYRQAVDLVPYRGDWVYSLAGLVRHVSGPGAAIPLYDHSLGLAPFYEQAIVAKAESELETGRIDDAKASLERAWTITPYDWRVHHLAGVLAMQEQRPKDAVDALRRAQELAPRLDPVIQTPLADALYASAEYGEAVREASRAIQLQPLLPAHRLVRGKAHLALGHAEDARKDLAWAARAYRAQMGRGRDVERALFEAEERLASAFIAERRPLDALEPLERLSGDSPDAAAEAAGRLLLWLQRMGARAPAELWAFVIDSLIEEGEFDKADESLARCETLYPDGADGIFIAPKARVMLSRGRADDALEFLMAATDEAKSRPEYGVALAQAHALAGNPATAALEYRQLLDSSHSSPRIKRQAAEGLAALASQ